jgi:hypothetical protein
MYRNCEINYLYQKQSQKNLVFLRGNYFLQSPTKANKLHPMKI